MTFNSPDLLDARLFPLPGVVLFPGTLLPLRVFEPRYRQLLSDALAGDRLIAMPQLKESSAGLRADTVAPPIHDVFGLGQVVAHEQMADGTSHIVLLGQSRCKVKAEIPHTPYRMVQAIALADRSPEDDAGWERLREAQGNLLHSARGLIKRTMEGDAAEALSAALKEQKSPGGLADLLASIYVQDAQLRQALLESVDVLARMRMLQAILEKQLGRLTPKPPPLNYSHENYCVN